MVYGFHPARRACSRSLGSLGPPPVMLPEKAMKAAGYNTFLLRSADVAIDLLTDSGTTAMSSDQWAAYDGARASATSSDDYLRLEKTLQDVLGYEHIIPTHQGRAAERIRTAQELVPAGEPLAAWVIGHFEEVLGKLVALAVLMPVVASMGGIAGSQTLTLMIRGLALDQIAASNVRWLTLKEILVGVLNGVGWALVVALVSYLWFHSTGIAGVIAAAMVLNLLAAAASGVPLISFCISQAKIVGSSR